MEYIRYCSNSIHFPINTVIYNTKDKIIGTWYLIKARDCENQWILRINATNLIKYSYTHLCNHKEFKCNRKNCNHTKNGEVPLMNVENIINGSSKLPLILLNEQFIAIEDFFSKPKSLRRRLLIPYNKRWINQSWGLVIRCEMCNTQFENLDDGFSKK